VINLSTTSINNDTSSDTCLPQGHIASDLSMIPSNIDMINSPPHYKGTDGREVIDVMESVWGTSFHIPTAIAYILRHHRKGAPVEDLKKARWWLQRWVAAKKLPRLVPINMNGGAESWSRSFGITDDRLTVAMSKLWLASNAMEFRRERANEAIKQLSMVIADMEHIHGQ
jgi:Protein of unknwon function (DUF3310)